MQKTLDFDGIKNYGNKRCFECNAELGVEHWKHIIEFNSEKTFMGFCDACSHEISKHQFDFINMENCYECKKLIGSVTPNNFRIGFDGINTFFYCANCYHLCQCKT